MNLLITGAWHPAKEHFLELENLGHRIVFLQNESDVLPCAPEWVEGIVCNALFLFHEIGQFVNLQYIQLTSAGFDRVPMSYVQPHHIEIHNAHGVYSIPMAESALCGVLQLYRHSRFFAENQKKRHWEKHHALPEVYGKTVCIVGCGNVGNECARRFVGFGCDVVGIDANPRRDVLYHEIFPLSQLNQALSSADIVILTLPLTNETKHMMNYERLSLLKESAILVNIARGAIVDTEALIAELPHLGGAVLDVFEEEPLGSDSVLWQTDNVILTPHNSFVGEGNEKRLHKVITDHLKSYLPKRG